MTDAAPFANIPPTPEGHFKLYFYAAILYVLDHVTRLFDAPEAALQEFPFLLGYHQQLAGCGLEGQDISEAAQWWQTALLEWEDTIDDHLPLRALREAAQIDHAALTQLITAGLIEEDPRFGVMFDTLQGSSGYQRPTIGLLSAWQNGEQDTRSNLRHLQQLGLIHIINPEAPRLDQGLQVPAPIWDALSGARPEVIAPWAHYRLPAGLVPSDDLILPAALHDTLHTLPTLLTSGEVQAVVVRGPRHNGRHTLLGALAREVGRGLLEIDQARQLDADHWRLIGPLSTLLHTLPVLTYELAPGESAEVNPLVGCDSPIGVVLSRTGGLAGAARDSAMIDRAVVITLELPDQTLRRQHWQRAAATHPIGDLNSIGDRYRLTSGNIYRAAQLAGAQASLANRDTIELEDVQHASRTLNRQTLETLAVHLPATGDWSQLAVCEDTQHDLQELEARCRQRERLAAASGAFAAHVNAGVRVLFSGPSGTGKTLAARVLAAQLQMDAYRLDLSAVVNKYIGETEKNLNQVFSRAEELDVILLIDEGDALLTQRTSVNTANDRYANLETNFLLQRLESFSGIVIVTTNSSELIDSAFQRRMDVTVDFRLPDTAERWQIWQLHLPATATIDERLLTEIVTRCTLTGGQIRNAALHATLLALNNGGIVTNEYVEAAVQREYRKLGAVCPLRHATVRE
jgi:predicted nucleic acid-binding protein